MKIIVMIILLSFSNIIYAESVDEIVKKSSYVSYFQGKDCKYQVNMYIFDRNGNKRERRFIALRKNQKNNENQKYYVYFLRPSDVRKMSYMVWKYSNGDDNRWLYLPALDLVKRIVASDKRTSFAGSHFLYEDISGRNIREDKHELLKTTKDYFILKNVPKKSSSVEFSYYIAWIHKKTFIPVKVLYYDKNGYKYREMKALKMKEIQGYPTVIFSVVNDIRTGGRTIMALRRIKYDLNLPENIFTERYLRKAPIEWLRK